MSLFKPIDKIFGGILKGIGLISSPSTKALNAPLPEASNDTAAAAIERDDELRRRKGAAADIITGPQGAEASLTGGKLILG